MVSSTNNIEGRPALFLLKISYHSIMVGIMVNLKVLLSICSLLTDPNPEDPLVPEIAQV